MTRREFLEIIQRQARVNNRTTFFSSHLIDEVERVADRVGMIQKGQLRYDGDIETLQASVRRVRYVQCETSTDEPPPPADDATAEPLVAELVAESACLAEERFTETPQPTDDASARRAFIDKAESNGFAVLRDDFEDSSSMILRGDVVAWEHAPFSPSSISRLSLEDIFIAEGTMEFLDSLPVSRSRVFAVNVGLALFLLWLLIVLDVATGVLLHALSQFAGSLVSYSATYNRRVSAHVSSIRGVESGIGTVVPSSFRLARARATVLGVHSAARVAAVDHRA